MTNTAPTTIYLVDGETDTDNWCAHHHEYHTAYTVVDALTDDGQVIKELATRAYCDT